MMSVQKLDRGCGRSRNPMRHRIIVKAALNLNSSTTTTTNWRTWASPYDRYDSSHGFLVHY